MMLLVWKGPEPKDQCSVTWCVGYVGMVLLVRKGPEPQDQCSGPGVSCT